MSEFADRLAALRAARVADLDLIAALFEQIKAARRARGRARSQLRRQHARPECRPSPSGGAREGLYCNFCGKPLRRGRQDQDVVLLAGAVRTGGITSTPACRSAAS